MENILSLQENILSELTESMEKVEISQSTQEYLNFLYDSVTEQQIRQIATARTSREGTLDLIERCLADLLPGFMHQVKTQVLQSLTSDLIPLK